MGHGEHADGKKLVNLWLDESERAQLKETAAMLGISVADVIRLAYKHFRAEVVIGSSEQKETKDADKADR